MPRTKAAIPTVQVSGESSGMRPYAVPSITDRLIRTVIDALTQVFSGLEMRYVLARQRHRFAGFGIAALTRRTKMQRKTSEAPDLDALSCCQRVAHDFQQLLDGE